VAERARLHFAKTTAAASLRQALAVGRRQKEYFLLSPNPDQFFVMTRPGNLMRQFARLLVAEAMNNPESANWARHPEKERAKAEAAEIAPLVPARIRTWQTQRKSKLS
jgi:hypothetical protein